MIAIRQRREVRASHPNPIHVWGKLNHLSTSLAVMLGAVLLAIAPTGFAQTPAPPSASPEEVRGLLPKGVVEGLPAGAEWLDETPDDGQFCEDGDSWNGDSWNGDAGNGDGDAERSPRAPKPTVLLSADKSNWQLSSADRRAVWTPIEYQPLTMRCEAPEGFAPSAIAFYIDGHPYEGIHAGDDRAEPLTCPPLGRHLIQARYLDPELGWSQISEPLRFEVLSPRRPKIISVHDAEDGGGPVNSGTGSMITTGSIRLRLANLQPTAKIFIYLDQRLIGNATAIDNCRFDFSILGVATPGEHEITVRQIPSGAPCDVASPVSEPVKIHYFRQATYVRKRSVTLPTQNAPKDTENPTPASKTSAATPSTLSEPLHFVTAENASDTNAESDPPVDKDSGKPADKPSDEPAEKPAEKPAAKPAVKPAGKPAEKPAGKPAEKLAEKPAERPIDETGQQADKGESAIKLRKLEVIAKLKTAIANANAAKAVAEAEAAKAKASAEATRTQALVAAATEQGKNAANRDIEVERARADAAKHVANANLRQSRGAVGAVLEFADGLIRSYFPPPSPAVHSEAASGNNSRQIHTFTSVAQFPLRKYSLRGEPMEQDGVMIYEGMTFAFHPDGQYEVSFRTSTPQVPAMLRLQFVVKLSDGTCHTLTLAPIDVRSLHDFRQDDAELAGQHFVRGGSLSGLVFPDSGTTIREVRREGTARFGYDRAQTSTQWKR